MKKLLLTLVVILSILTLSACQTNEKQTDTDIELETYDYYLLIVMSRQNLNQGNYSYVLHEAGKPLTSDNFTYETDQLWSVGEFVLAIEIDEEGNVYFTDLDATTDIIVSQYQGQIEMQSLYNELKLDYYEERYGVDLDDTPEDFEKFLYENYRELYDYMKEETK